MSINPTELGKQFLRNYKRPNELRRLALQSGESVGLVDFTDSSGFTALHHASRDGYLESVTLLLSLGADPAKESSTSVAYNVTPLYLAAKYGQLGCVRALLEEPLQCAKAIVSKCSIFARTPEQEAAHKATEKSSAKTKTRYNEIVRLLQEYHANGFRLRSPKPMSFLDEIVHATGQQVQVEGETKVKEVPGCIWPLMKDGHMISSIVLSRSVNAEKERLRFISQVTRVMSFACEHIIPFRGLTICSENNEPAYITDPVSTDVVVTDTPETRTRVLEYCIAVSMAVQYLASRGLFLPMMKMGDFRLVGTPAVLKLCNLSHCFATDDIDDFATEKPLFYSPPEYFEPTSNSFAPTGNSYSVAHIWFFLIVGEVKELADVKQRTYPYGTTRFIDEYPAIAGTRLASLLANMWCGTQEKRMPLPLATTTLRAIGLKELNAVLTLARPELDAGPQPVEQPSPSASDAPIAMQDQPSKMVAPEIVIPEKRITDNQAASMCYARMMGLLDEMVRVLDGTDVCHSNVPDYVREVAHHHTTTLFSAQRDMDIAAASGEAALRLIEQYKVREYDLDAKIGRCNERAAQGGSATIRVNLIQELNKNAAACAVFRGHEEAFEDVVFLNITRMPQFTLYCVQLKKGASYFRIGVAHETYERPVGRADRIETDIPFFCGQSLANIAYAYLSRPPAPGRVMVDFFRGAPVPRVWLTGFLNHFFNMSATYITILED